MANKAPVPFRFGDLPPELRLNIYRYALTSPLPIDLQLKLHDLQPGPQVERRTSATSTNNAKSNDGSTPVRYTLNMAILLVSRAIYNESRCVLYGENTFLVSIENTTKQLDLVSIKDATKQLDLILPSKRLILHVEIRVSNFMDLIEGVTKLVTETLRYFSNLKTLRVLIPEDPVKKDWTLGSGDYLFDKTSHGSKWAHEWLAEKLRMLPRKAQIEFTGLGKGLVDSKKIDRYATEIYGRCKALRELSGQAEDLSRKSHAVQTTRGRLAGVS
ncbi:hypothetical protein F5Y10DRAFT_144912 [Nemania abortiva]|nr:hypothetical protein F5Y10DRAFT_144912 [Nemania abortiva]